MKSCWNWPLLKPMSLDNRSDVLTVSLHLHFKSVSHSEASQSVKGRRRFPPIFPQPEIICIFSKTFLTFEVRSRVGWWAWSGSSVPYLRLYSSFESCSISTNTASLPWCHEGLRDGCRNCDLGLNSLENRGWVNNKPQDEVTCANNWEYLSFPKVPFLSRSNCRDSIGLPNYYYLYKSMGYLQQFYNFTICKVQFEMESTSLASLPSLLIFHSNYLQKWCYWVLYNFTICKAEAQLKMESTLLASFPCISIFHSNYLQKGCYSSASCLEVICTSYPISRLGEVYFIALP